MVKQPFGPPIDAPAYVRNGGKGNKNGGGNKQQQNGGTGNRAPNRGDNGGILMIIGIICLICISISC